MSFWKKVAAGIEAVGLDPQDFGVVNNEPPRQQEWRPGPAVPGDSYYVSPSHQMAVREQQKQQQGHGHAAQPMHGHGGYGHTSGAYAGPEDEKEREIERMRKEMRKVEEKTTFFKNQVMTLQQQVNSMPGGASGSSAGASTSTCSAAELQSLRQELQREQARTQQLRSQWAAAPAARGAPALGNVASPEREALEARVRDLQEELAAARAGAATAGIGAVATPTRSGTRAMNRSISADGESPMPSMGSPGTGMLPGGRGDLLDPVQQPGGTRRAVIIGCDYPGQTGSLRAGVADAQQWARFFTKRCGIPEKDIRLLSDNRDVYMQYDRDSAVATRTNIMRALQWLTARSASGDQLFFIFCGHGVQVVAEEFAGKRLCENALAPTDVAADGGAQPRVVSDTDVHKALLMVPSGVQATLIYDSCHAGAPLDRSGLNYLTEQVKRGTVDYDKLKSHPVLPRFLELGHWKVKPNPPEAVRESCVRCQAVQWAACENSQFCVELPIEERSRGVFTYIFICALLKEGVASSSDALLHEMRSLTQSLKGRWRLQQDSRMVFSGSTSGQQLFLR